MILARHAEAMLWAGRYMERAESTARCFEIEANSIMYLMPDAARSEWEGLVSALGLEEEFAAVGGMANRRDVAAFLLSDADNPGSVVSSVTSVRENLRAVRDRIPIELWDEANYLYLQLRALVNDRTINHEPHEVFLMVRRSCLALSGVLGDAMRRDEGHDFLVIGKMLERAVFTVGLLRARLADPEGVGGLSGSGDSSDPRAWLDAARLLRLTSALQAFRRAHGHDPTANRVAGYLLSSRYTPRSVLSSLSVAEELLRGLSGVAPALDRPRRRAGLICARLELSDIEADLAADLPGLLGGLAADVGELAGAVPAAITPSLGSAALSAHYVRPGHHGAGT